MVQHTGFIPVNRKNGQTAVAAFLSRVVLQFEGILCTVQAALQYVKLQRRTDAAALAFSSLFLGNLLDGAGVAAVRCQKKALARTDGAVGIQTRIAVQAVGKATVQAVDLLQQLKIQPLFGGGFLALDVVFVDVHVLSARSNRSRILLSGLSDASAKPTA